MKWCIREFRLFELPALENWLQDMAEKGWLLKTIRGGTFFCFEKIEPTRMLFSAKVIGEMSVLSAENCDVARDYRSYCEEAGWRFVTSNRVMQIFAAEETAKPIPIATDENLEFEAVWKQTRKAILGQSILAIFWLCSLFLSLKNPESFLRESSFYGDLILVMMCIYLLLDSLRGLLWYIRGRKAQKEFRKISYYGASGKPWHGTWMIFGFTMLAVFFAFFIYFLYLNGPELGIYLLIYFVGYFALLLFIQHLVRKRGFSKGMYAVLACGCGIAFAIAMMITFDILQGIGITDDFLKKDTEANWVLTEEDLRFETDSLEEVYAEANRSPLGQMQEYWAFQDEYYLSYTFYETRWAGLMKWLEKDIMEPYKTDYSDVMISGLEKPVKTISGVEISGIYEKLVLKGTGELLEENFRGYFFKTEDKLLFLRHFDSELSEEELMEIVAKKLKVS